MLQLSNQKTIPKLHVMSLVAEDVKGSSHLFVFVTVAISKQDAFIKGLENMKTNIPQLYYLGQANNGFRIANHQVLTYTEIQRNFKAIMETEQIPPPLNIQIVPDLVPQPEAEVGRRSKAMKKIIDKGNLEYLDKKAGKYTEFEVEYMRAEIKRSHENT